MRIDILFTYFTFGSIITLSQFFKIITLGFIASQEISILQKDFGYHSNCIPEFPTEWKYPKFGIPMTSCNTQCYKTGSPTDTVATLQDDVDHSGQIRFTQNFSTPFQDHSVVIMDALFVVNNISKLLVYIGSKKINVNSPYREAQYLNTYNVECPLYNGKLKHFYNIYRMTLTPNVLDILILTSISTDPLLGLTKIKVTTNCVMNCQVCQSGTSCSTCLPGFQKVIITSGTTLCEEILQCPTNCTTCAYDNYQLKCLSCIGGYTLNPTNYKCEANPIVTPCPAGQYTDKSGVCQDYTSKCGIFDKIVKRYVPCTSEDPKLYKCPKESFALIYFLDDQYVAKCGCSDNNCEECSTLITCVKCKAGFQINIFDGQCDKICNPGEFYNRVSDICETCKGDNCVECVQQVCTKCTLPSMFVDPLIPQNCKICTVTDCEKCFDDGKCSVCKNTYNLSSDYKSCTFCSEGLVYNPSTNICECLSPNCDKCKSNDANKCSTCKDGYQLVSDQCVCLFPNCFQCAPTDPKICVKCDIGFTLTDPSTCCGVVNCQKCVQGDSNLCEKCKDNSDIIEYTLSSDQTKCDSKTIPKKNNDFSFTYQLISNYFDIRINFASPIVFNLGMDDLSKLFNVQISSIDQSQIQLVFKQISSTQIQVILTPLQSFKQSDIIVTIIDQAFYDSNKFLEKKQSQKLNPIEVISQPKNQNKSYKTIGEVIGYAIIPCAVFGNFFAISNAIEYIGFLYYLIYLDIKYPDNIESFYKIFQGFKLPFIPNIFEKSVSSEYLQASTSRFMELNTDNYFLNNTGQVITILLIGVATYAFGKLLSKANMPGISKYLQNSIKESWEFGVLMGILWSFYIFLLIGVLLQLNTYNFDDTNSAGLNYSVHSIFLIFTIGFPIYLTYLLIRAEDLNENLSLQQKLQQPLQGIQLYSKEDPDLVVSQKNKYQKYSKYNCIVLYARKIFFCIIIVFAQEHVYLQIATLSSLNLLVIGFYLVVQPFKERIVQIRFIMQEVVLIIFQGFAAILFEDSDNQDENKRINLGWVIISFSLFMIGWLTLLFLKELISNVYLIFKKIFSSSTSNKVVPLNQKTDIKDLSPTLPKTSHRQNLFRQSADSNNVTFINMHSTNLALSQKQSSSEVDKLFPYN